MLEIHFAGEEGALAQAFSGVRVLDFTQVLAGPFGVMQLAVLGADVIKVEQPGTGDQTRGLMSDQNDGMAPSFLTCNVNKRSIAIDLKSDEGRRLALKLAATCDVVVENFKAGVIGRLGLGYDDIREVRPDVIFCSVSGYGQTGPKAGVGAYDGAIQAASGMMSQTGFPETGPTRTGYMPVDMTTALNTALAISAALYRRQVTGEGQFIDVAMMDTAIVAQAAQFSNYLNSGRLIGLGGNHSPTGQPTADVFPTTDGYLQITALRDAQVEALFDVLGHPEQLEDPAFADIPSRIGNAETVRTFVADAMRTEPTAHWLDALAARGVPVAEVRTLPEVVQDPQLRTREVLERIPSPLDPDGEITIVKAGYLTDRDGPSVRRGPPRLGEHTIEILSELGMPDEDVERLAGAGVIA